MRLRDKRESFCDNGWHMISRSVVFDKIRQFRFPLILLLGNLLVVLGTELAHDEAYYWLFSKNLAWGYFDHPPMAAWLIALSNWMPGEIGVRFTFLVLTQLSVWLLAAMSPREMRWVVWLGFCTFPLLAFSGVFAIPDGPLVIFSALWLWSLQNFLKNQGLKSSLILGLLTSLLFYSKYHGILYVIGTIIALPKLIKNKYFWIAAAFGFFLYLPHIQWQWRHDFATFRYHFIDRPRVEVGYRQPLEFVLLQIFLPGVFIAPFIWISFFMNKSMDEFERALKCIAIFVPLFFFTSTFSKKIEANWTVAAGIPLLLFIARKGLYWVDSKVWRISVIASLVAVTSAKILMVVPPSWHPIRRAHEFHGWADWAQKVRSAAGDCKLAANRYQFASKLSFYLKEDVPALNVGTRLNQFEFWDWQESWKDQKICWVTERKIFPYESADTPDGKNLVLVKDVKLSDIMVHKTKSL